MGLAVAPAMGALVPAWIVWPDGRELQVTSREELVAALRERMAWLVERGREGGLSEVELANRRRAAWAALDAVERGGRLTVEACGPRSDVRCAAAVEPVAMLRWRGFRAGWDEPELGARRHPVLCEFDGEFQRVYQDAVHAGILAARAHRTDVRGHR